jgi:hypothetical protein
MGDCFTAGFPFNDRNTGGTLDGLIRAHEKVLPTIDDRTILIRGHCPLGNKARGIRWPRAGRSEAGPFLQTPTT